MTDPTSDIPDPAERRAAELLALVATQRPELSEQFAGLLLARAQRQAAVAAPLRAFGVFLLALAGAAQAALLPVERGERP